MNPRSRLRVAACAALLCSLVATSAWAAKGMPPNIDSRDLRPGMKGYGLTVMRGQKIERFQIEVIGVLYNKLPGQDMILVRCAGLNLEHSGVIAGMSGSPVFIKGPRGKDLLVGAVSYAFPFNKDPVAGVTPIKNMWPELDRPLRPVPKPQQILMPGSRRGKRSKRRRRRRRRSSLYPNLNIEAAPVSEQPQRTTQLPGGLDPSRMQPIAMPLSASGFHPDLMKEMQTAFNPLGFGPVQAAAVGATAAGGAINPKSEPFRPGSAISLSLVRGDMNIAGVGTVTWVRKNKFIAFGHPFRGAGQIHLPVGGAHIVWVTASQVNSFKMGVPLSPLGVLDQDRLPAVAGRIGPKAAMIPMQVRVRGKGGGTDRTWKVEIVDQPKFFPLAVSMVLGNALRVSEPIAQNAWATMKLTFELEGGYKPLVFEDKFVSLGGSAGLYRVRGLAKRVAKALVSNGFKRIRTKSIKAEFQVEQGRPMAFLEAVKVDSDTVHVGDSPTLRVQFLRPNKKSVTVKLKLPKIPKELAGGKIRVWIGSANRKPLERPQPQDENDILDSMRAYQPSNRLVAVLTLPGRSWMTRGERLVDVPPGVMTEITGHRRKIRLGRTTLRTTKDLDWAITGSGTISLMVADDP
ncbi:MAG: hypothetical protein KC502_03350 [Myxococcales bacterium]|nr:hypothetical protein [Myxococcales bacterium]